MKVNPLCFTNKNFFFVKPDGSYLPCCYSSTTNEMRQHLLEKYNQLNLQHNSIDDVLNSEAWQEITKKIKSDEPYRFCLDFCPAHLEARSTDDTGVFWDGATNSKAF